jgi:cytochrome P450
MDAVVRELIRMLPSIPSTVRTFLGLRSGDVREFSPEGSRAHRKIREATQDDIIPLAHPITTSTGETLTSIPIRKGQVVHLPIENVNMSTHIWGPDAREFKPERWLRPDTSVEAEGSGGEGMRTGVPPEVGDGPGVWPNMMTFIDGPRRCVGYRLGLMEMKIILYTLIREFEFRVVPGKHVYMINM